MKLASFIPLILCFPVIACSDLSSDELQDKSDDKRSEYRASDVQHQNSYIDTSFGIRTQMGHDILSQAQEWTITQIDEADEYAQPRMCAHNVSKVLEMSQLNAYSDYLIPNLLNAVAVRGGLVQHLDVRDKQGFVRSLNQLFDGHLPIGSLINGCLYKDCGGKGGDGHIAILGHTDDEGIVYLYHNNWYRPDNEDGKRKAHMVSEEYYDDYDLRRQWMATPWIRVHRDLDTHEIIDVEGLLPALDDLDPYSGFFLTVSIVPEILQELDVDLSQDLFCPKDMIADPMLGVCSSADPNSDHVYGSFSDEMIQSCVDKGFGMACTTTHIVETNNYRASMQRWSRSVYKRLRGDSACPQGLSLNHEIGYCIQKGDDALGTEDEAFGPFSKELVDDCFRWGGGNACASGRWSLSFLKTILNFTWIP